MPTPSCQCAHCGLPAPAGPAPVFCCPGCATVHAALQRFGLQRFYEIREQLGTESSASTTAKTEDYEHFDDPELLAQHGFAPGHITLRVAGLHCAACVWVLERLPKVLPGLHALRVDLSAATVTIDWNPTIQRLGVVASAMHELGYAPTLASADADDIERTQRRRTLWRLGVTGALAGNTMLAAFALYAGELSHMDAGFTRLFTWLGLLFALPAVTWGAWPFYAGAWAGLRVRVLHMDLPIALGILTGFVASGYNAVVGNGHVYFDTVTTLVFLLLVGRHLQAWGQRRGRDDQELLASMVPGRARKKTDAGFAFVRRDRISIGDILLVATDERFPSDGRLVCGHGHADVSLLTGESRPDPIGPGSEVFAGATNVGDPVEIEVTATGFATRFGQIVTRLCSDDVRRAPIVQLADRIAGGFVITVLLLAAVGGATWWTIDPTRAVDVVVAVLVVSCPCALGLATPMALSVARARAMRLGIVLRSAGPLELLARTKNVIFDKTGTLTLGKLQIVRHSLPSRFHGAVAAIERHSRHPIARAIVEWGDHSSAPVVATAVREIPGCGIEGVVGTSKVRIGSVGWCGVATSHPDVVLALEHVQTPIAVEVDGRIQGLIAIADQLDPSAIAVVSRLRALGKSVSLASGDHPEVVEAIARRLGIDQFVGGCSPEGKAALVDASAPAIMIGDGVNDALALDRAEVGIAMGGGARAALAAAEVYVASNRLSDIPLLFEGAAATRRVIIRNLGFSLVYNLLFMALAQAGYVTPLLAAILMPISSLSVVASSFWDGVFRPAVRAQNMRCSSGASNGFALENAVQKAI